MKVADSYRRMKNLDIPFKDQNCLRLTDVLLILSPILNVCLLLQLPISHNVTTFS